MHKVCTSLQVKVKNFYKKCNRLLFTVNKRGHPLKARECAHKAETGYAVVLPSFPGKIYKQNTHANMGKMKHVMQSVAKLSGCR
jgi:hypothetical protein